MTDNDEMTETRHERLAREAEKHRVHEALAEEVARLRAQKAEMLEALRQVSVKYVVGEKSACPSTLQKALHEVRCVAHIAIRRAEEWK